MKVMIAIIMLMFYLTISDTEKPKNLTVPEAFLERYEYVAVDLMEEYDIPASVILGVSMLESGYGTSNVSQTKNNYFGIRTGSHYREYETDIDSFIDFCKVLSRKKYYANLTDKEIIDYKIWIDKINNGGYAESEHWHPRVLAIVKKYELYKIDESSN